MSVRQQIIDRYLKRVQVLRRLIWATDPVTGEDRVAADAREVHYSYSKPYPPSTPSSRRPGLVPSEAPALAGDPEQRLLEMLERIRSLMNDRRNGRATDGEVERALLELDRVDEEAAHWWKESFDLHRPLAPGAGYAAVSAATTLRDEVANASPAPRDRSTR